MNKYKMSKGTICASFIYGILIALLLIVNALSIPSC
jgi:hypothetical protein